MVDDYDIFLQLLKVVLILWSLVGTWDEPICYGMSLVLQWFYLGCLHKSSTNSAFTCTSQYIQILAMFL